MEEERWDLSDHNRVATPLVTGAAKNELGVEELDALHAFSEGKRIVTVIGFAGSGKTFFVNRLRHDLREALWRCTPAPQDEIVQNPVGLQLTRLVPLKSRAKNLNYLMVDLAGESFQKASESGFKTGQIGGFSATSYLSAIAFASAYILVIRVEDLEGAVEGRDGREVNWVRDLMYNFHTILSCIVVCADKLATGGQLQEVSEELLKNGLSTEDLKKSFEGRLQCRRPICVLFSLADRFEKGLDDTNKEIYDCDPFLYAAKRIPKLFIPIWDAFTYFRFDYMSSFWEHQTGVKVNYRLPSHGAVPAFLWIHDLLDRGRIGRIWGGMLNTRQAVGLRRRVDPDFAAVLKDIEHRSRRGVAA